MCVPRYTLRAHRKRKSAPNQRTIGSNQLWIRIWISVSKRFYERKYILLVSCPEVSFLVMSTRKKSNNKKVIFWNLNRFFLHGYFQISNKYQRYLRIQMRFQKELGPIVTSILDSWETTISTVYECEWQPAQMLRRHKEHTMRLAILLCIPITTWLPHIT